MGSYNCSREEIYDKIEEALNDLDGEVYRQDFIDATKDIYNKYRYFSDKKKKKKVGLMKFLRKREIKK